MVCSIINFIVLYFVAYRLFKLFLANTNSRLLQKGHDEAKRTKMCKRIDLHFLFMKTVIKKVKERNENNK